jgi:hypothetical protein
MARSLTLSPTHWIYLLVHGIGILVGFLLWSQGNPLQQAIGSSVIAAGITGYVVFIYVFLSQSTAERIAVLHRLGLVSGFEARAARIKPEYDQRLATVKEHIDVLGFGLQAMRQDFLRQFPEWKRRAHVRILLIDPEFPGPYSSYAEQRDKEEQNAPRRTESDVRQFVRETRALWENGKFEVKLYRCLPSVNIFRVDDEMFWGPYLVREQSRNVPTLIVNSSGILFERLLKHFDTIWNDELLSRNVPEDWKTE